MVIPLSIFLFSKNFFFKERMNCEAKNISVEQAYNLYKNQNAIFIDARFKGFYDYERINGAFSFPLMEKGKWSTDLKKTIEKKTVIVVYCDNYVCGLSGELANYLVQIGYCNVFNLFGGIDAWKENGYPIISSTQF